MTINKPHSASVSAEENLHRKLDAIDKRDADVRAFIEVYREEALKSAKEVDKHIKNGKAGPLAGLVVAVKNNIAVKGRRLTCSSKMRILSICSYMRSCFCRLVFGCSGPASSVPSTAD